MNRTGNKTVAVFPLARQTARVNEVAHYVLLKQGLKADRYWRLQIRRIYAELQLLGIDETTIEAEIEAFAHAVQAAVYRMSGIGDRNRPGAA